MRLTNLIYLQVRWFKPTIIKPKPRGFNADTVQNWTLCTVDATQIPPHNGDRRGLDRHGLHFVTYPSSPQSEYSHIVHSGANLSIITLAQSDIFVQCRQLYSQEFLSKTMNRQQISKTLTQLGLNNAAITTKIQVWLNPL